MVHTLVFLQSVPYPTGFFICDLCHEKGSGPVLHCSACLFDLHPSCIATGEQISHFSHYNHPLHMETLDSSKAHTCDICGDIAFPTVYHCSQCDFDSHPHCARASRFIQHPCHKHTLQLMKKSEAYSSGSCWCDGCSKEATNLVYHCSTCKFDLHVFCAMLPCNPLHPRHPEHRLKLISKSDGKGRKFFCAVCRKDSTQWMYACEDCRFYMHVSCGNLPRHEAPPSLAMSGDSPSLPSSSDIEKVVKVMDRLLVSADTINSSEGNAVRRVMKILEQQQQSAPVSITASASRVSRDGPNRNTCPTCLDEYDSERQKRNLRCGHHFHTGCILRWLDNSNRCPVCRQQVLFIDGQ